MAFSKLWARARGLTSGRCDPARTGRTHHVARAVSEGVHLFQGITDATMGHGEGWQYLQAGRFLERWADPGKGSPFASVGSPVAAGVASSSTEPSSFRSGRKDPQP